MFLAGTDTKLIDPLSAADFIAADPHCALALIEARQSPEFLARLAQDGQTPRKLSEIKGINYSNGRRLDLTLYAGEPGASVTPPPSPPAHP